ncbi:MAG: DUF177 domain-containing protein [Dehalococcoidia bacterium]|jgi:uncharacterized protein|nr:DUF177 domain-containing protein [Dehalococcoidia bacterium]MDW8008684.1 DUF177 domain-containing protein [Chloroflexota bacterium]
MRYHVSHELKQAVGARTLFALREEHVCLQEGLVLDRLDGTVEVIRTNKGLLVRVQVAGRGHGQCARCLTDLDYPVRLQFEEEFLPVADVFTGAPLRIPEGADNFLIGADFVLDLHEPLRQYALMAEPINPLCRPDCRGLCPQCGSDLNAGACRCAPLFDSRWEALRALAARLDPEEE